VSGKDYHDYVIKDGRLVGEFDEMYRESSNVPWHQDETAYGIFSDLDVTILNAWRESLSINSMLEVGCGLGYFTNRLKQEAGINVVTGLDVSSTAIGEARERFGSNGVDFIVGDMASDAFTVPDEKFDLVMEKEVLWYVLDVFFENMMNASRKYIYISQCFPGSEIYLGKDIFPNGNAIVDYVSSFSNVLYSVSECDSRFGGGRELIHILAEKK